ncbi:hypothetical protein [Echinicola sp. 20G]|uniref:hypothetical protein n=1 Tax=Echinicola sp. 20G TaxID=2781961 RepID=UPI0019110B62|nr:hypothetical protein [Echinicola sp. 20G]
MSVLKEHISIPKKVSTKDDLDFHYLRELGIAYIEQLGGKLWTDYNSHDPGITILEMLSYAITDLGMRLELPITDILASNDPSKDINSQFFKASEVLPTSPITEIDYRKLFIDIEGVKNCWLAKHEKTVYANCKDAKLSYDPNVFNAIPQGQKKAFELNGLYDLYVDYEDLEAEEIEEIEEQIRKKYHQNRNLCEDLIDIHPVDKYPVKVCADIEVEAGADEEMVHALVLNALDKYFSPSVNFYSIKQMMDKGYGSLEIFDGPILEHGFIDHKELSEANLRSEIRLSDIMQLIMDVPGVKLIKEITMGNCGEVDEGNEWVMCLKPYEKPLLCSKSVFNYKKGLLPLSINKAQVSKYLEELETQEEASIIAASQDKEIEIPKGTYLKTDYYTTIQNDFPQTYGIGKYGLPDRATIARKSQAKQLKAYLLFFDQILGSYFKHLGQVSQLLSINRNLTKTFFTQAIDDIKDLDEIVNNYPMNDDELLTNELFEELDNNFQRRNEILDHLLSRFAERFSEYTFIMKLLYGTATDEMVLRSKEDFLKEYKVVSTNRGKAFNLHPENPDKLWDTSNVSGFQKRVARLLGVKNYNRRHLSRSYVDMYSLTNSLGDKVYRWRIRNADNTIVLSGTEEYYDTYLANREMYFAILQVIQTSPYKIEAAFQENITVPLVVDNIQVHQSNSGKYSYDIINPAIGDKNHPDWILAKRYSYYGSQETVKNSILDLITFLKEVFTEEGMFLVEHILLRPDINDNNAAENTFLPICDEGCTDCEPLDPYSYRVSIVLPGYTMRFSNTDFRNYMEKVIKEELPAHVLAKICWVGYREGEVDDPADNELLQFEDAYKDYLEAKTSLDQEQPEPELVKLIEALMGLNNVYPVGRLFDCEDENEELGGKVILGKTNLGSL